MWETINHFPRVFLVEGNPLDPSVLRRAFIHKADKAVIMGYDSSIVIDPFSELTDEMIDAKPIFIYKTIKKMNPRLQILTELSY